MGPSWARNSSSDGSSDTMSIFASMVDGLRYFLLTTFSIDDLLDGCVGSFFRLESKVDVDRSDVELPPRHVSGLMAHADFWLVKKPPEVDAADCNRKESSKRGSIG